ncbi:sugar ABC transporter permease, partial [Listeria monocytogenes]
LINSFQVYAQVIIMNEGGKSGETMTLVQNIYNHAFRYFEKRYASAMSWILFIVIFIITIIQNKRQKIFSNY